MGHQNGFKKYPKIKRIGHDDNSGMLDGGYLVVQEKLDGANCLPYNQRIQTDEGAVSIGKIVNNQLDVKVLSYDPNTGSMEYKPITGYFKNGRTDNWVRIEFDGVSSSMMVVTGDHKVYTDNGPKAASSLSVGDKLKTRKTAMSDNMKEFVIGSVLGDASIIDWDSNKNCHIEETHGENQHDYTEWKASVLGNIVNYVWSHESSYDDEHDATTKLSLRSKSSPIFDEIVDHMYNEDGKYIPENIELSWRSIAVWYCDDGSANHILTDTQRERVSFHTQSFSEEGAKILLEEMGLNGCVVNYGDGPIIELTADATETLFSNIAQYVPQCMKRKIPDKFWDNNCNWDITTDRYHYTITDISQINPRSKQRYDIEVADNHNYVTKDVIVSNCRLTWDEDEERIVFGSRNVEYWNESDTDSAFAHAVAFVREHVDSDMLAELNTDYESITIFGEAMHAHTLEYGQPVQDGDAQVWDDVPNVLVFDVWTQSNGFLDWSVAKPIIDDIGLEPVPVMYTGLADEWSPPTDDEEFPESAYRDGLPEGLVVRNEITDQTAKIRTQKFKERHDAQSVTNPDDYEPSDGMMLARQYATEARVLKQIHKYEDSGRTIEMSVMEDLWRDVFDDIIEEEYDTIFLGNHTINTKEFRSEVASITANVLQTYLERPDGSVLNESGDE